MVSLNPAYALIVLFKKDDALILSMLYGLW